MSHKDLTHTHTHTVLIVCECVCTYCTLIHSSVGESAYLRVCTTGYYTAAACVYVHVFTCTSSCVSSVLECVLKVGRVLLLLFSWC